MSIYSISLHLHSVLRYVTLAFLLISLGLSLKRYFQTSVSSVFSLKFPLFTLIAFHIQLLIGIVLYIVSPKVQFSSITMKVDLFRFFTMEHSLMMLITVALITIGYSRAKKNIQGKAYKQVLIYYGVSLLILLIAIPWPFRHSLGGSWF